MWLSDITFPLVFIFLRYIRDPLQPKNVGKEKFDSIGAVSSPREFASSHLTNTIPKVLVLQYLNLAENYVVKHQVRNRMTMNFLNAVNLFF